MTDDAPHPMWTDEPGVLVHRPRKKLAQVLTLYAVLPLVCAAAGAFIAYQFAAVEIDRRVAALEADLDQRRQANAEANRERDARLEQTRADLCVVVNRVQPRDAALEEVRRRYGCTAPPAPSPSPGTSSSVPPPTGPAGPSGVGGGERPPSGSGPAGRAARPTPAPAPRPPSPSSPPPLLDVDVCVPLIEVCARARASVE